VCNPATGCRFKKVSSSPLAWQDNFFNTVCKC